MIRPHALAIALILLAAASPAAAQELRLGAKAGVNLARVALDDEEGGAALEARPGLVAGLFVTWHILPWLQVQPEVLYTSKGGRVAEEGIDSRLILDYLEVPLLARMSRRMSRTTLYVAAGPAMAWRLRATARTRFNGATEELDLAEDVEPFDLGIAFGGGLEAGRLVIDGRYTFGLSDLDADTSDATRLGNRVGSVTAGFRF